MEKKKSVLRFACIMILTIVLFTPSLVVNGEEWKASWSSGAAKEAEAVAAIPCSGHGRAYLDGLVLDGHLPACECHPCYGGSDCSQYLSDCVVNSGSGDPLFLEPFWRQHAASSALLVSGWHRMSYSYSDGSYISELLVKHIIKVHDIARNAKTDGKYIVFGAGSTQLMNAAVYALSPNSSSSSNPAKVVTTAPNYAAYRTQTELFNSRDYRYEGDTSLWRNKTDESTRFIEFVTSPTNPDGKLTTAVLKGSNVKPIYDHTYYWPHYIAIPAPSDEDLMLFTISKLTGHAGTRFGWAIIKDAEVYEKMLSYLSANTIGVSRDAQLRALKLLNVVLQGEGREIFEFGYSTMRDRWIRLKNVLSKTKRFSLQNSLSPQYCSFFQRTRDPTTAYAWLKCERKEDEDCYSVLRAAEINGHPGSNYGADNRYMRLSLIRSKDDFDILINKLNKLVAQS